MCGGGREKEEEGERNPPLNKNYNVQIIGLLIKKILNIYSVPDGCLVI